MTAPTNPPVPPAPPVPADPSTPPTTPGEETTDPRDVEIAGLKSEAARWRKALREREGELEALKLTGASEAERAIAAAKAEGASQYQTKWRRAVVENAALAALADRGVTATEPALRSLDLDDIDVDADGRFDRSVLAGKVEALIVRYPIFAPTGSSPSIPTLTGDGQRRTTPPQMRQGASDKDAEDLLRYGLGG